LRSASIAAECVERTIPSPAQVGHFFGHVLARHLDQAERRDLDDVGLRPVALELGLQRFLDGRPVLRVRHVDEVDDDDPADIAQPELVHDLLDRLEVVRGDRVLEPSAGRLRARADEAARVDVDHRERLRVVEDEVPARREVDPARERGPDRVLDALRLEEGGLLAIADDAVDHVRRGLLEVADDPLVRAVVVDERLLEVVGEEVARDAERQLALLVDERRRLRLGGVGLDRLPELLEEREVPLDVLRGRPLGRRADDDAAVLGDDRLEDLLQPAALGVRELARDAGHRAVRHVDQVAARQRDLAGQPRALGLHRVLDRLDEDLLVALEEVLDLAAAAALELGRDDLVDVQEAVLLEADLDERGLHAREDVVDGALVDVAGDRAAFRTLEVDLGRAAVLDHGDPLLADVDREEEFALRLRERRAALRLATALLLLALRALAALLRRLAVGLLLLGGLGLFFRRRLGRRGGRLPPVASAARPSPASFPLSCRV
jgi:hypothetical protein